MKNVQGLNATSNFETQTNRKRKQRVPIKKIPGRLRPEWVTVHRILDCRIMMMIKEGNVISAL